MVGQYQNKMIGSIDVAVWGPTELGNLAAFFWNFNTDIWVKYF
jgi:hypothetical protein